MKKERQVLYALLIGGLVVIFFLGLNYFVLIKERNVMSKQLKLLEVEVNNYKAELDAEQKEFALKVSQMLAEKEALQNELTVIRTKFEETKVLLVNVKKDMDFLKEDNKVLSEKASGLETKLLDLNEEKLELQRRITSLKELQKAIKDARKRERELRRAEKKLKAQVLSNTGNRGYLVKEGKSTATPKFIIRVLPAKTGSDDK